VIFSIPDGLGAQDMINLMPTRILVRPLSNSVEHVFLNFNMLIPKGWVMESPEDIITNFLNRHPWVFPSV
jgi:hypothetical protein